MDGRDRAAIHRQIDPSPFLSLLRTRRSGRHELLGDLAPAAGGQDAGPSPKELVMLGLASCTSMTVRSSQLSSRLFWL